MTPATGAPSLEPEVAPLPRRASTVPGGGADAKSTARGLALFPPHDERTRCNDLLTRELAAADQRIVAGAVAPTLDLAAFTADLAAFDFMRRARSTRCWNGPSPRWSTESST